MVDQPRDPLDFSDLEAKENERRAAIGLPPLPKRVWKHMSRYNEEDIEEYMAEVRETAKSIHRDQKKQLAYIEKARKTLMLQVGSAGEKKVKPKPTDKVLLAGPNGPVTATIEDVVKSTREETRKTETDFDKAFPTLSGAVKTPGKEDKAQNARIQTFGQKLASFEKDVFRRAFPVLSKVIDTLEGNRRVESKEKSRTAMRERRVLDKTEQTAVALESLSREQERSVDLLRELLETVRAMPGERPNTPGVSGRFGRLGRALRRALPAAAGVGLGLGAYALYSSMQTEEEPETPEQPQQQVVGASNEDLIQRVSFDVKTPSLETSQPEMKADAGPLLKSGLESVLQKTETEGGVKSLPAPVAQATPVPMSRPQLSGTDSTPAELAPAESNQREMVLKARKVVFKGDEILFRGLQSTGGPSMGGAASDLDFAPRVDQRVNSDIAQKVERIESDSGKDFLITSGFRDAARNAGAGGATGSAHTRGNAVDIQFNGNEADTAAVIESAKKAGIGGIGVYRPGMLHLDTESSRAWGPDFTSKSIPEWAKGALQGEGLNQASAAAPVASGASTGAAVMGASQENAMAERTPTAPTVVMSDSSPAGQASPGTGVPGTLNSPDDPGPVEPEDASERYAMLFNMAA